MKAMLNSRVYGPNQSIVANRGNEVTIIGASGPYRSLPQSTAMGVGQVSKEYIVRLADGSKATVDGVDLDVSGEEED